MGRWNRNASTVEAQVRLQIAARLEEERRAAAEAARNQKQEHEHFLSEAAKAHLVQKAARRSAAGSTPVEPAPVSDLPMLVLDDSEAASDTDAEAPAEAPSIDTETAVKRELVEWLTSNHPAHGEDDPIVLMRSKRAHLVELVEGVLASPHQPQ